MLGRERSPAQNRIDRALLLARRPPTTGIDIHTDPLALVVAAVNELYGRGTDTEDEQFRHCARLLLADVAKRRRECRLPEIPLQLARGEGNA